MDLNNISAYSTLATAIIAFVALIIAIFQIWVTKRESRLSIAKGIYKDYLALAFDNPEFSSADKIKYENFLNDPEKLDKYEFFVSFLLFAAEEILELSKNDVAWKKTLKDQLIYHEPYLESEIFKDDFYSKDLKKIIDSVKKSKI